MSLTFEVFKESGTSAEDIIADAMIAAIKRGSFVGKDPAKRFRRLVLGSIKSTAYQLKTNLMMGISTNKYRIEPLRKHPTAQVEMGPYIRRFLRGGKSQRAVKRYKTQRGINIALASFTGKAKIPGVGFRQLIRYQVGESGGTDTAKIGILGKNEGGIAGMYWKDAAEEWVEPGTIDIPGYGGSMNRFLAAIGIPVSFNRTMRRPGRPLFERAQAMEKPLDILRAKLFERLSK